MVRTGKFPDGNPLHWAVLPTELHNERVRLLSEGFSEWTKTTFTQFLRASSKFGRNNYEGNRR
jgi:hypothetical protein